MSAEGTQRLDKWLWVARFFKTRGLAAEAVSGGKVHVDGQRAKAARPVRPDQVIRVRKGEWEITVVVRGLATTRRPAREAEALYEETAESLRQRQQSAAAQRATAGHPGQGAGRPTKRDRRQLARLGRDQGTGS
ncbi:MAG: S4 domain-containing protein [Gammaproteobacteria bacterium]|nr:S4 domain-containing protein [Gammaproteobacteria bacterium]